MNKQQRHKGRSSNQLPIPLIDRILVKYLRAPDHPMKRRIEDIVIRASGRDTLRCVDAAGILYDASPWECVQSNILRAGSYEPATLALVKRLLVPGSVMIDAGSNIGEFTLLAASIVGATGRVIAIEPSPVIYETLRRNIALNGFENITALLLAAAATDGIAQFGALPDHNWGMNRQSSQVGEKPCVCVAARSMEHIMGDCDLDRCDLLKVDVEGREIDVLRGIDYSSERRPRHIIVECIADLQEMANGSVATLTSLLSENGYELRDVFGGEFDSSHELPENNLWAFDRTRA